MRALTLGLALAPACDASLATSASRINTAASLRRPVRQPADGVNIHQTGLGHLDTNRPRKLKGRELGLRNACKALSVVRQLGNPRSRLTSRGNSKPSILIGNRELELNSGKRELQSRRWLVVRGLGFLLWIRLQWLLSRLNRDHPKSSWEIVATDPRQ
jgi:hypothetical protein